MNKIGKTILLLAALLITPSVFHMEADAATLEVGPLKTYQTISDAIAAASPGDEIWVEAGAYTEDLILSKAVTIKPESGSVAVTGDITITSGGVTLNDITVEQPAISSKDAAVTISLPTGTTSGVTLNNCILTPDGGKNGVKIQTAAATPVVLDVAAGAGVPVAVNNDHVLSSFDAPGYVVVQQGKAATVTVGTTPVTATYQVTVPDMAPINNFISDVSALPAPAAATLADQPATEALITRYDAFTAVQKELVPSAYLTKLNELTARFLQLNQQTNDVIAANAVTTAITALPTPASTTPSDYQQVLAAKALYDALTAQQKQLISAATLQKLQNCIERASTTLTYTTSVNRVKITVKGFFDPSWRLTVQDILRSSGSSSLWKDMDDAVSGRKCQQIVEVYWKANGALPEPTGLTVTVGISSSVSRRSPRLIYTDGWGRLYDMSAGVGSYKLTFTTDTLGIFGVVARSASSSTGSGGNYYDDDDDDYDYVYTSFTQVRSDIRNARDNTTVKVNISGDNPIPTSVLTALADRKTVTAVFHGNDLFSWTVGGSKVETAKIPNNRITYDLKVKTGSPFDTAIKERFKSATIGPQTFTTTQYKGVLPGTFTLSLHTRIYPGIQVNVYLYQNDGSYLLLADRVKVDSNGWVTFNTATAGTYVVTNGTVTAAKATTATSSAASSATSTAPSPSSQIASSEPPDVSLPEESISSSTSEREAEIPAGPADPGENNSPDAEVGSSSPYMGTTILICAGALGLFSLLGVAAAIFAGKRNYRGL